MKIDRFQASRFRDPGVPRDSARQLILHCHNRGWQYYGGIKFCGWMYSIVEDMSHLSQQIRNSTSKEFRKRIARGEYFNFLWIIIRMNNLKLRERERERLLNVYIIYNYSWEDDIVILDFWRFFYKIIANFKMNDKPHLLYLTINDCITSIKFQQIFLKWIKKYIKWNEEFSDDLIERKAFVLPVRFG